MAYAAVLDLKTIVGSYLQTVGPCFSPPCLILLEVAHKELQSFQEFLNGLGGNTRKRMSASLRRTTEAILEFGDELGSRLQDQIDSQLEAGKRGLLSLEVQSLKQEFHVIFETMKKTKKERFNGDADFGGRKSKIVGLSDVYNKLKQDILVGRRRSRVKFFSIVGMAGIGKTTLAAAIFEDLDVLECFEYHVWVSVGKNCQLDEIARRILSQLNSSNVLKLEGGDRDMREILKGERWLIVLDDVWDAGVCRHLESLLPNDKNGSRVILTSRSRRVVQKAKYIRDMRLLNEKESWVLLREKVFGEKHCPTELEEVGKKIAKMCDGLPLTIVIVAGLLLKIPKPLWIDVATKRKHQLFVDAYDEISKVLYPSYEDLPQRLKFCFLYMAVFPPNYKIPRSRLMNMWFVEELLESNAIKSVEDCTDECLQEFSSNSLVMVYQKRIRSSLSMSTEETKSCGLHSSWWHLCYTEAKKNNFFYIFISREDRLERDTSQSILSFHNNILFAIKDVHDSVEKNSASTAYSLLCLGSYHRYQVPICFGLKLLKNLDTHNIRLYKFPLEVLELDGLKYFALNCDEELPVSISKLQNLQFFIVHRHHNIKSHGAPSYLPVEIWDMKEMKHFHIMGKDLPEHFCNTILPHLSTLLGVSDRSCTKDIFKRIPYLKKLGIRIELAPDASEAFHCFDHISQLNELEILKCIIVNPTEHKVRSSLSLFPLGLKKLTLNGFGYPWEEMSKIASLPCLEVLKLQCNAFHGPKWEVEENGFPAVTFLLIEDINLMQWKVGRGSFEMLKFISIKHCYKFKEVHWESEVAEELISKIEIVDCNPSLENRIREAFLRHEHMIYDFSVQSSWEEEDVKT